MPLHFYMYVDSSLPKLAELADQYFAFRPRLFSKKLWR